MKAILLDIEGTTTPIEFVHKTLFPYAKAKIDAFVAANFDDLGTEIAELAREYRTDFANQIYGRSFDPNAPQSVASYAKFLIDVDRKSKPLKSIQGRIWESGYKNGELESAMFADILPAFERWRAEEKLIAIFSSGSILAQQLIFKYSNHGDLSGFIEEYFDTETGPKRDPESYVKIARELRFRPADILFVSDVVAELDAARDAGFKTLLSIRPGNGLIKAPISHDAVASFEDSE